MDTKKRKYNIAGCILACIIATVVCCISMKIWDLDWTALPGEIGGDGTLACFLIKSMQENGIKGLFVNHRVGAPDWAYLIDVPFFDVNLMILAYVFNFLTKSYTTTYYLIYITSYSMVALTMYLTLNRFKIKWWVNVAFSVLFATAPYHFLRGMGHITLSNYAIIPVGLYLAFVVLEEDFRIITKTDVGRKINRKSIFILLAAMFVGNGQLYYAFFVLIVMMMALIVKMIRGKSCKPLFHEGIIIYVICLFVLLGIMPKIIFGIMYGENAVAGIRIPMEAELYGMRIIQLLMPVSYSRLPFAGKMYKEYVISGVTITENIMSSLGAIGSICFLFVCGWLIYSFASKKMADKLASRLDFLSMATLTIVLYCTIGGIGTIFNFLVTPQVRALNRASILIACIVLVAGALLVNKISKKTLSVVLCIVLLVVGMYDQVLIYARGWQSKGKVMQEMYETYYAQIEAETEAGSMIYQLPFMNFPEAPAQYRMLDYAPFAGYLFTDTLCWSYGAVIGRNGASAELYVDEGKSRDFVNGIKNAGFAGVLIDIYGYADYGEEMIEFYRSLELKEIVSLDHRFYYFEL